MKDATSIKQLINYIANNSSTPITIEQGIITKGEPLEIMLVKDKKIKLGSMDLIVPAHLKGELKNGDKVHLLVTNNGKQFFVLGKV